MPDVTDREIEEKLKEALAELEQGFLDDDDPNLQSLDPAPTIEDVKRAMYRLRVDAALIRQHAERLELHARHLGERLSPIQSEDVRELVRDDPENAAKILHFVRVLGIEPLAMADQAADAVGIVAEHVGFFALRLQGRSTGTGSGG